MINITNKKNQTVGMIKHASGKINCYTPCGILFVQVTVKDMEVADMMNKMCENPELFCDLMMDSYIEYGDIRYGVAA